MTHHLMQYLDTPKPQAQTPQQGAGKYHGAVAKGYDAKRVKDDKWICEQRIILTARVANHPHARSIELIESALSGWRIHRNEAGYTLDYRVIELRPQ